MIKRSNCMSYARTVNRCSFDFFCFWLHQMNHNRQRRNVNDTYHFSPMFNVFIMLKMLKIYLNRSKWSWKKIANKLTWHPKIYVYWFWQFPEIQSCHIRGRHFIKVVDLFRPISFFIRFFAEWINWFICDKFERVNQYHV